MVNFTGIFIPMMGFWGEVFLRKLHEFLFLLNLRLVERQDNPLKTQFYIQMPQNLIIAFPAVLITFLVKGLPSIKFACEGTTPRVKSGSWDTETVLSSKFYQMLGLGYITSVYLPPPFCSEGAGPYKSPFWEPDLGRVSMSPPKSCLAQKRKNLTSFKSWRKKLQFHKSMMLWKVDWRYFWGFKLCVQKYWDNLYLYSFHFFQNHWTKAFRYCKSGLCVSEHACFTRLSDSIHS